MSLVLKQSIIVVSLVYEDVTAVGITCSKYDVYNEPNQARETGYEPGKEEKSIIVGHIAPNNSTAPNHYSSSNHNMAEFNKYMRRRT